MSDYRLSHILHKDDSGSPARAVADFLVMLVMTATAAGWFLYCFFGWFKPAILIFSCIAVLLVLGLWLYDLRGFSGGLVVLLLFLALIFFVPWEKGFFFTAHKYILDFISWIAATQALPSTLLHPRFGQVLIFLFVLLSSLCVTFLIKIFRSAFACGLFGLCAFMSLSAIQNISPPPLIPTLIYLSLFLAGCFYFYSGFAFVRRNIGGSYFKWQMKTIGLWLVPLALVLVFALGKGGISYQSPAFATKVDATLSKISLGTFSLPNLPPLPDLFPNIPPSGQGNTSPMTSTVTVKLGGARVAGSSPVFDVSPSSNADPVQGRYYFKLNTFTSYNGEGWRKTGNTSFTQAYSASDMGVIHEESGFSRVNVTLSNFRQADASIPAPQNIQTILGKYPSGTEISKNVYDEYKLSRHISPADGFDTVFSVPNMGLAGGWVGAYSQDADADAKALFSQVFTGGVDSSITGCLDLPSAMPKRVYTLANELTAGLTDSYSKAAAICDYLQSSYTYTTTPPAYNGDFVDDFLFESKQGYCTYFATAMTVLCRAVGVPTRYVEGYALGAYSAVTEPLTVTGANAHAWCEVYFGELGWLIFDATAGGVGNPVTEETVTPPPAPPVDTGVAPEVPPETPEVLPEKTPPQVIPPPQAEAVPEDSSPLDSAPSEFFLFLAKILPVLKYVGAGLTVIALACCYYFLRRKVYRKQNLLYRSKSAPRHALEEYNELLHFAKLLGVEKVVGESPRQHLQRFRQIFDEADEQAWFQAIACVEKAAYSAALPDAALCTALAETRELAANKLIEKHGEIWLILAWRRGSA